MDINLAIERQRKPLLRIVAALFALIGLVEGKPVERLSFPVYRQVLRVLRPAESAVRRLIVVTARIVTLKPPRPRLATRPLPGMPRKGRGRAAFQLFDPRQRLSSIAGYRYSRRISRAPRPEPRVRVIDTSLDPRVPLFRRLQHIEPAPPPVLADTVNAIRISRRLLAIKSALEDLPRQAKRYLRWQAKPSAGRRPQLASALRPGAPPGHRKSPSHKVDEILAECDWLARQPPQPDTS